MIFLCDAMNIMYKINTTSNLLNKSKSHFLDARKEFIKIIIFFSLHYKKNKSHSFHIFFDGVEKNLNIEVYENIKVYYCYGERVADQEIYDYIKAYEIKQNLCVISSDSEIKKYSIRKKCEYWTSEKFAELYEKLYLNYQKNQNSIIIKKNNVKNELFIFQNKMQNQKYFNENLISKEKKKMFQSSSKIEFSKKEIKNSKENYPKLKENEINEYIQLFKSQKRDAKYKIKRESRPLPFKKTDNNSLQTYSNKNQNLDFSLKNPDVNPNIKLNHKQVNFYLKIFEQGKK